DTGQSGGEAEREKLVPVRGHAEHFRHVLVVVDGEESRAPASPLDGVRRRDGRRGDGEAEEVQGGRRRPNNAWHRHGTEVPPRPAVDARVEHDGGDYERDREREEREQLPAQPPHPEDDGPPAPAEP